MFPNPRSHRGFTLLEITMVLLVASLLVAGFTSAVLVSERTQANVSTVSEMENDAHEAVQRIADELRPSGTVSSGWDLQGSSATYSLCTGEVAGVKTWGGQRRLYLAPMTSGETSITDGIDNNGDGRVDESMLVLRRILDDEAVLEDCLVRDVASGGLTFVQSGNDIAVNLTLQRKNPDGSPITVAAGTVVSPRNWGSTQGSEEVADDGGGAGDDHDGDDHDGDDDHGDDHDDHGDDDHGDDHDGDDDHGDDHDH